MQKTALWDGSSVRAANSRISRFRPFTKTLLAMLYGETAKQATNRKTIVLAMKLTVLLLTAAFLNVHAGGKAQSITFSGRDVPLKRVFEAIKKQTGYVVFSSKGTLEKSHTVSLSVNDMALADFLKMILKDQPVSFSFSKKTIILAETRVPSAGREASMTLPEFIPITGVVRGTDGQLLAGVNLTIKGTQKVVSTDDKGRFSLNAEAGSILVVSFVGYESQEIRISNDLTINILLKQSVSALDETVVVGYGTTKRKDLTGSVSSVNVSEFKDVPFATIDQALSGKAAGVQVVQADGSPGGVAKIRIRGGTSLLGGNDPLYIIDGVQMQVQNRYITGAAEIMSPVENFGGSYAGDNPANTIAGSFTRGINSLGGLNINDIESIDILKDASATAIYGSKAANGVVIITTKKGKLNQKPVLEANYYTGISTPIKEKLLNRDQYIMIMKEGAKNLNDLREGLDDPATYPPDPVATEIMNNPDFFGTANTDWLNLVLRNGVTTNADISVRGGGTGSRYYASLSYNKNNGVVLGTDFTRIAGKISLDNDISSKLRVITNLDYGFSTNNLTNGVYTQALFAPPTISAYGPDGTPKIISDSENGSFGFEGFQNPLLMLKGINRSNSLSLIGSLALEYDILKDLKFRSTVSANYNNYRQTNFIPSTVLISDALTAGYPGSSNNGIATQAQSQHTDIFYENTVSWNRQFSENSRLNLLAGTSWQITKSNSFSASGQGFPDDDYLNNLSSAALTLPATGVSGQNSLLSFYLRANYSLSEKYLFTFTGRSDASSKFPQKNRVGYFPSGGIGWRISKENFLKNVRWIDEIKLRASVGYTGTQNIADNLFYTLYSPVSYNGLNGLAPNQLGNESIKWESTLQKDAGIDFQFFNARLSGGIGYYEKSTSGVLFPATVDRTSGFAGVTANIADIRNRGLEITIRAEFIRNRNLQWSGTFNIAGNRSKVLALSNDFADPSNPKVYKYGNTVLKVGEPLGLLYGNLFDGIIKNQKEADEYRAHSYLYYLGIQPYLGVGDAKFILDAPVSQTYSFTKTGIIGHAEPTYYGGYTNSLTYKNFTLTALATFSYGGDMFYLADAQNQNTLLRTNKGIKILERWTPENPNASRPRLILGDGELNTSESASNNVYKASYIKMKSISLNYQFPKLLLDKLKVSNASVYVAATNLFTITSYPGADPEVSNDPYSLIGGYSDNSSFPTVKQFSMGIRFGF